MSPYRTAAPRETERVNRWIPILGWRANVLTSLVLGGLMSAATFSRTWFVAMTLYHAVFMWVTDYVLWRYAGRECRERFRGASWRGTPQAETVRRGQP